MSSPAPPNAAYPMHLCSVDGIVYDQHRNAWYGPVEPKRELHCPECGMKMEGEPKGAPTMHFCYQCGVTFDRTRKVWYGLSFHLTPH